jgi:hypothetical protein
MKNSKSKINPEDEIYLQNIDIFENFNDYVLTQISLEQEQQEYQEHFEQHNSKR